MNLRAGIGLDIGPLRVDVDLDADAGQVLALLGPNGAGKTTVLRALAGLESLRSGRVTLRDSSDSEVVLDDPATGAFIRPEHRPIGMVFQDYLLFPHLSVLDNIAFGLRSHGATRRQAAAVARRWVDRFDLNSVANAAPSAISGGQAQRTALARALCPEPRLLLLDEPLAALDATSKTSVRRDLRHHLDQFDGITIMVTHDPLDAFALADRVVVMESGTVTQSGDLAEVTHRPRTAYVADLVGVNLLHGIGETNTGPTNTGPTNTVRLDSGATIATAVPIEGPCLVVIRPNSVTVHPRRPDSSARNQWRCTVSGFDVLGDHLRVRLDGAFSLTAEVTPAAIAELGLVPGSEVWATVKATDVACYLA